MQQNCWRTEELIKEKEWDIKKATRDFQEKGLYFKQMKPKQSKNLKDEYIKAK